MSIHARIKSAREAKGWSMEQLAEKVSEVELLSKPLTWQTVQQWEKATAPKRKRLEVVARLLDLSVAELLGADAERSAGGDEFVQVRRADVKFSNGFGRVVYAEDDHPPIVFRADFLRKRGISKGNAVVVDAEGVSNEPRIMDGSVVLVDRGDCERLNGDFFAFRMDGELLIKRLEYVDGVGILATAENPNFKPKTKFYTNVQDFEVIGRAVWVGAEL